MFGGALQANTEEELPEELIGTVRLSQLEVNNAMSFEAKNAEGDESHPKTE